MEAKVVLLGETGVGKTSLALRYVHGTFSLASNPTIGASFLTASVVLPASFAGDPPAGGAPVAAGSAGGATAGGTGGASSHLGGLGGGGGGGLGDGLGGVGAAPGASPGAGAGGATADGGAGGGGPARLKLLIWDTAGQDRFKTLAPMYYRSAAAAIVVFDVTDLGSFGKAREWVAELQVNVFEEVVIALVGNQVDKRYRRIERADAEGYAASVGAFYAETSAKTNEGVDALFLEIARRLVQQRPSPFPPDSGAGLGVGGRVGSTVHLAGASNGGRAKGGGRAGGILPCCSSSSS